MKKTHIVRHGLVLLLALTLLIQLGTVPVSADTPVAGADGTVEIWRWERVDSQDDLPRRDSAGYRHPVLLLYEWNNGKYMVDGSRRTSSSPFQFIRTDLPEGVAYGEKSFRTLNNIANMELYYRSEDSENGNARQYSFVIGSADGALQSIAYSEQHKGFLTATGKTNTVISVLTPGVVSSADIASGHVGLLYNVAYDRDVRIYADDDSGNINCQHSWLWSSMTQFVMYVGYKEQLSAIRSDVTIGSGQVANYNGYVYIEPNVTVTIEEGGVLSVSGVLYNNGTIVNNGGDIVVQKDATIEQFCLGGSKGGAILCNGGDLVILSGGCVTTGTGTGSASLTLSSGATCTNFGTLAVGASAQVDSGATLDNRSSGTMLFAYKPKAAYSGTLNTLSSTVKSSASTYENVTDNGTGSLQNAEMLVVGKDVLLRNEGTVRVGFWIMQEESGTDSVTASGSGRIYIPSWAVQCIEQWTWTNTFPSAWRDMLTVA